MAFVTKYKLKRALGKIEGQFSADPIFRYLYSKYFYLPNKETTHLTVYYNFSKDPKKFVEDGHFKWADTKKNAVEVPPAYHTKSDCQALHMRFDNVVLPEKIQMNDSLLLEARKIAKEVGLYRFGQKKHEELVQFINVCISKMNERHRLEFSPSEFQIIHEQENSGNTTYHNMTLVEIKAFLEDLRKEAFDYFGLNDVGRLVIPNSFFTTPMKYSDKLEKHNRLQVLERYRDFIRLIAFKKNIKYNNTDFCTNEEIISIAQEIKTKFIEPTVSAIEEEILKQADSTDFSRTVLQIIGFNRCYGCSANDQLTQGEEDYIDRYKIK